MQQPLLSLNPLSCTLIISIRHTLYALMSLTVDIFILMKLRYDSASMIAQRMAEYAH